MKNKNFNFKDYFKLPFKSDEYGSYIWDSDGHMVAYGNMSVNKIIVDIINDFEPLKKPSSTVEYDNSNGIIINTKNGKTVLVIRGFGYLTGTGGCSLSENDAVEVQRQLGEFIVEKINSKLYK